MQESLGKLAFEAYREAVAFSLPWEELTADAQLGWIVRFGMEEGVPTPLNAALIRQVHQIEVRDRPQSWENLKELRTFS